MKRTEMKRSGPIKPRATPKTSKMKTQAPARRSAMKTRERTRTPKEIELHDRLAALGCIACMKALIEHFRAAGRMPRDDISLFLCMSPSGGRKYIQELVADSVIQIVDFEPLLAAFYGFAGA